MSELIGKKVVHILDALCERRLQRMPDDTCVPECLHDTPQAAWQRIVDSAPPGLALDPMSYVVVEATVGQQNALGAHHLALDWTRSCPVRVALERASAGLTWHGQ